MDVYFFFKFSDLIEQSTFLKVFTNKFLLILT